ncbi:MAG: FG-GAP repeat protein, partial [Vicinamibacterales bacterium]
TASILSQAALAPVADLGWQIALAADVNGDSHPDLIWRNTTTGANVVWFLSGTTLLSQASLQTVADTNWTLRP